LNRARARLAELDAALARSEAGDYGRCVICGDPIGDERLAARPGADRCIRCASTAGPR
jgi:RNA polymerase-binding transcription factor DksA